MSDGHREQPFWKARPLHAAALGLFAAALVAIGAFAFLGRDLLTPAPIRVAKTMPHPVRVAAAKPKAAAAKKIPMPAAPSAFQKEQAMSFGQLMRRWDPLIGEAAKRFKVPAPWIRAVMQIESGGRTMLGENQKIVSSAGAMGLMQLMPDTYDDMRRDHKLGADPFDPHDNIMAGAAYLQFLRGKYGYPAMFAAYNDGPGNLEERMMRGGLLPLETRNYLTNIAARLEGRSAGHGASVKLTRPNGQPVLIDAGTVVSVRAALPDEYAPGVLSVITVGRLKQGVREPVATARALIRMRGGAV